MQIPERRVTAEIPPGSNDVRNRLETAFCLVDAEIYPRIDLSVNGNGVGPLAAFITLATDRRDYDLFMQLSMAGACPDVVVQDPKTGEHSFWLVPARENPDIVFGVEKVGDEHSYFIARPQAE
jgi:hypothetical protein